MRLAMTETACEAGTKRHAIREIPMEAVKQAAGGIVIQHGIVVHD